MEFFHCPSTVAYILAGYIYLGYQSLIFRIWNEFIQNVLCFKVFIEKSGLILEGFSLFVTCVVLLPTFSTLFLFSVFALLTVICHDDFI